MKLGGYKKVRKIVINNDDHINTIRELIENRLIILNTMIRDCLDEKRRMFKENDIRGEYWFENKAKDLISERSKLESIHYVLFRCRFY